MKLKEYARVELKNTKNIRALINTFGDIKSSRRRIVLRVDVLGTKEWNIETVEPCKPIDSWHGFCPYLTYTDKIKRWWK